LRALVTESDDESDDEASFNGDWPLEKPDTSDESDNSHSSSSESEEEEHHINSAKATKRTARSDPNKSRSVKDPKKNPLKRTSQPQDGRESKRTKTQPTRIVSPPLDETIPSDDQLEIMDETEIDFRNEALVKAWEAALLRKEMRGNSASANINQPPAPPADAPEWFTNIYQQVARISKGPNFDKLLDHFVELERSYGFSPGTRTGLPIRMRPKEIELWIREGRTEVATSRVIDASKFGAEFEKWWRCLQPSWRNWPRGKSPARDVYGEDWDSLVHPGQNGMSCVVAALAWWYIPAMKDDELKKRWDEMVKDVDWVMEGMCQQLKMNSEEAREKRKRVVRK
jgi:hypothetical protein